MDSKFLNTSIKYLVPIILIFAILYVRNTNSGDYYFHLNNTGTEDYPKGMAVVLSVFCSIMSRELAIWLLNVLFVILLPFVFIYKITKNLEASWVYLYASQLVFVLGFTWLLPQALIHVFMLASIAYVPFFIVFALLGPFMHGYWFMGLFLAAAYKLGKIRGII